MPSVLDMLGPVHSTQMLLRHPNFARMLMASPDKVRERARLMLQLADAAEQTARGELAIEVAVSLAGSSDA